MITGRQAKAGNLHADTLIELDPDREILKVDGREVELRRQSFEVLRILTENRGRIVSKATLLERVWGNTPVTDDSLVQCLADIRRVLGDTDKTLVRTVPRRGYIFEGDLVPPAVTGDPGNDRRRTALKFAPIVLLAGAIIAWFAVDGTPGPRGSEAQQSIAVLPFTDMTTSQEQRFLAEGLSEEILNLLTQAGRLRVIARTSSFLLTQSGADIAEIGAALRVGYVLEGSVRQGDDRLRITAQLVRTSDSSHVWSQAYDRPMGDILEIQSDIARSVAHALEVALELAAVPADPANSQAHALVIQARSMLHLGSAEENMRAQTLLRRALEIDPENVAAHLQLARAILNQTSGDPDSERTLQAWLQFNELTDRAYALDPDDAFTNAGKGWQAMHFYQDWERAARFYERAMALDPTNLDTGRNVVNALIILGDADAAVALGKYVIERDPLCMTCYEMLSIAATIAGDFELSEAIVLEALQILPEDDNVWSNLAYVRLVRGDNDGTLAALEKMDREGRHDLAARAIANYRLGNIGEFEAARRELIEIHGEGSPITVSQVEAVAGNIDAAFDWLDKQLEEPAWRRGVNYRSVFYRKLRSDPRWETYLERLGLSERQREQINFRPNLPH